MGIWALKKLLALILFSILVFVPASAQEAFACALEDVQHWNKIVFQVGGNFEHPTLPLITTFNQPHEVIVQVDPNVVNTPRQLVSDKLTAMGYSIEGLGTDIGIIDITAIVDVEYSAFCNVLGLAQVVGGMLIQPDGTALVIAYGIANAIWLVPSVAGIGIAVYLVKRKL